MRNLIPLFTIAMGVALVIALLTYPGDLTAAAHAQGPAAAGDKPAAPDAAPSQPSTRIEPFGGELAYRPGTARQGVTIGSTDKDSLFKMRVDLPDHGYPAIKRITLTDYKVQPRGNDHYVVQSIAEQKHFVDGVEKPKYAIYPLTPWAVTINEKTIDLFGAVWNFKQQTVGSDGRQSVTYGLDIVEKTGDEYERVVLKIEREFQLDTGSYDLIVNQRFINHSGRELSIVWETLVQGDAPFEKSAYARDERFLIFGYFNPQYDMDRSYVSAADAIWSRTDVLDATHKSGRPVWPNAELHNNAELVWFSVVNRYFGAAIHPVVEMDDQQGVTFTALHNYYKLVTVPIILGEKGGDQYSDGRKMVLALKSRPFTLAPDQAKALNLGFFAGPRSSGLFAAEPYESMGFGEMLVYTLGCTLCTFQPLAKALLWFLKMLHAVVQDWGVAIILLVCFVRMVLHPITKRSQINMMKMGKQTQALKPEIDKIKKKYANDQTKIGQETMRLYREQGVNPVTGMLGCVPMLLQMPIWVALYAMLYTAIELRHEPAFYSVFQAVFGETPLGQFLLDLSVPDRFWSFYDEPRYFQVLLFNFDYSSFNILPILMGVVFFIQQKLTMTPATTDEMRRQQKIMSVMMTVLFPLMMYSVPSGLTLYILTSTGIGIIESSIVRKHIREQEEDGTLFNPKSPKKPKPGGLMDRLHKAVEAKQRAAKSRGSGKSGSGGYKQRKRP